MPFLHFSVTISVLRLLLPDCEGIEVKFHARICILCFWGHQFACLNLCINSKHHLTSADPQGSLLFHSMCSKLLCSCELDHYIIMVLSPSSMVLCSCEECQEKINIESMNFSKKALWAITCNIYIILNSSWNRFFLFKFEKAFEHLWVSWFSWSCYISGINCSALAGELCQLDWPLAFKINYYHVIPRGSKPKKLQMVVGKWRNVCYLGESMSTYSTLW